MHARSCTGTSLVTPVVGKLCNVKRVEAEKPKSLLGPPRTASGQPHGLLPLQL